MSRARKPRRSSNIQSRRDMLAAQELPMPVRGHRSRRNIEVEDMKIDMVGCNTPQGKGPQTPRHVSTRADQDVQTPRSQNLCTRESAPIPMTTPATEHKYQHPSVSGRQQTKPSQDGRRSPTVQIPRYANAAPTRNNYSKVKARQAQILDFEQIPVSAQCSKQCATTYDPIRDPLHPVHAESDFPLPSVEDANAIQEHVRVRNKRRNVT